MNFSKLIVWVITALPHHFISRLFFFISRLENSVFQRYLIRWYRKHFNIKLDEVSNPDLDSYKHLNAFFVRALRPEARPVQNQNHGIVSPVDGKISQSGDIIDGTLIQAKNHSYDLDSLVGDSDFAAPFLNGHFTTIYLSPKDYHRIHMPLEGSLTEMLHIPGRLFSVSPFAVNNIDRLFARNERVVCLFDTAAGKMALILVGAINVAAIETVWEGLITPPKGKTITASQYTKNSITIAAGDEMGRFNMGSTVILLTEQGKINWETDTLNPETALKMGQRIGQISQETNTADSG